jgi:DNA-binding Xre family transcriptional regulator
MMRHRSMRKKELKKKPGIAENNIRYPNIAASL